MTATGYTPTIANQRLWPSIEQMWIADVSLPMIAARTGLTLKVLTREITEMQANGHDLDDALRSHDDSEYLAEDVVAAVRLDNGLPVWVQEMSYWEGVGHKGGYAYVIRAGRSGPIKVGKAMKPEARLAELQTGAWDELNLLHVLPGYSNTETYFHRKLRPARIRGEWFRGVEADQFVAWLDTEWTSIITQHKKDGTLPKFTQPRSEYRGRGIPSGAFNKPGLQNRWPLGPKDYRPVTVKYVDPAEMQPGSQPTVPGKPSVLSPEGERAWGSVPEYALRDLGKLANEK